MRYVDHGGVGIRAARNAAPFSYAAELLTAEVHYGLLDERRTDMTWRRWLMSRCAVPWASFMLASVALMVVTCFAGDVAIVLAATYRPRIRVIHLRAFLDVAIFLGYRVLSRYGDPQWLRVWGI